MALPILPAGRLISLEGIDGSGKSSLAQFLARELAQLEYPIVLTREPGATPLGQQIRKVLQERPCPVYPEAEFLLFAADRAQHMAQIVEPALHKGTIVLSDRMADSSRAYQGFGRGLDEQFIAQVNAWAMKQRTPDLTIYIQVDYETAAQRIAKRNEQRTSFEQEEAGFFKRIINGFNILFKDRSNVLILDGNQPFE
nr:dTMP kinase [Candidatus Dependentiae bacterium]